MVLESSKYNRSNINYINQLLEDFKKIKETSQYEKA